MTTTDHSITISPSARQVRESPVRIVLVAGQHGNEPEGVLLAHRVFSDLHDRIGRDELDLEVVLFGCMNPRGLAISSRGHGPYDRDMNRQWATPAVDHCPAMGELWSACTGRGHYIHRESRPSHRQRVLVLDFHSMTTGEPIVYASCLSGQEPVSPFDLKIIGCDVEEYPGRLAMELSKAGVEAYTIEARIGQALGDLGSVVLRGIDAWMKC